MNQTDEKINALLAELDHPAADEVRGLDRQILALHPEVKHGVKWNTVSYRTSEWFLTFRSHPKTKIEFVFHLGAKPKPESQVQAIPDPAGLLDWKGPDRATVTFSDKADLVERTPLLLDLISEWIKRL